VSTLQWLFPRLYAAFDDLRRIRDALERLSSPFDIRHRRDGELYKPRQFQSEK